MMDRYNRMSNNNEYRTNFRRSSYRFLDEISKSFDDDEWGDTHRDDSGAYEDFQPPKSAMETLDRRISLSSDQLDTLRQINRPPPPTPSNHFRSRSASRNKLLTQEECKKKINFNLKCESPDKKRERARKSRKTAVDIFLEDEGPYSRTLYGPPPPVEKDSKDEEKPLLSTISGEDTVLQRGLLWQQRDKFFSRWKERFFILTKDYLNCFRKGSSKLTEMGGFIFKLKLTDIESVDLLDKRGYLTICINIVKEGKIYLRRPEGIKEWFHSLQNNIFESKRKKRFWTRRQLSEGLDSWLVNRGPKLVGSPCDNYSPKAVSSPNIFSTSCGERVANDMSEKIPPKTTSVSTPRGINRMILVNELISKENIAENHKKLKKKLNEKDSGNDSGHNSINTMSDSQSEDNLSSPSKVQQIRHSSVQSTDTPSTMGNKGKSNLHRRYGSSQHPT
ncbi:uncharacterized protein [Lepeophtheirus salmonis]|nr:uncharacterized protein LOC121115367 [Lepeophtheirus salmonis]